MVKYRKIPPAAAANQIAENARIPPAADLQKNKIFSVHFLGVNMSKSNFSSSVWRMSRRMFVNIVPSRIIEIQQ